MKQWPRLLFFIFLNILVSACTTFGVLYLWDRTRAPLPGGLIAPLSVGLSRPTATPPPLPEETSLPQPTPTPAFTVHTVKDGDTFDSIAQTYKVSVDEIVTANGYTQAQALSPGELLRIPLHPLLIDSVIGAGDLMTERIVLQSNINGELSLAGWKVDDSAGNVYTFPQVAIFVKGGIINLFTKAGTDSVSDLYWGSSTPVWASGKTVILRDPQGAVQATYRIP
jgi:LysM repeat protein